MKKDIYFRTQNFYLAAFLFAKRLEIVGINPIDGKRCEFVFLDTPQRETLVDAFTFGKENNDLTLVDARMLITAIKNLKDKLFSVKKN